MIHWPDLKFSLIYLLLSPPQYTHLFISHTYTHVRTYKLTFTHMLHWNTYEKNNKSHTYPYFVLSAVVCAYYSLTALYCPLSTCLNLSTVSLGNYFCFHFPDEKTEMQKLKHLHKVTDQRVAEPRPEGSWMVSEAVFLTPLVYRVYHWGCMWL